MSASTENDLWNVICGPTSDWISENVLIPKHHQGCLAVLTNAGGLRATPCSVRLAGSSGRSHQYERRFALEEDFRLIGEAFATEPPLCRGAWVSAEHSYGRQRTVS